MTVIAWDGRTLAADRQSTAGDSFSTVQKLKVLNVPGMGRCIAGGCGDAVFILEHMEWLALGADPRTFPQQLRSSDVPSVVMLITPDKRCFVYENASLPLELLDKCAAIGSGRHFALAAMHLGYDARTAVETANALSTSCGGGVSTLCPGE